jgi:signal peptidase I
VVTHTSQGAASPGANDASQSIRREVFEFVRMVAIFLVLFLVLKSYVLEGYEVQGPSMEPTLHNSERILVFKLPHVLGFDSIDQGDIVVFDSTDDANKRYVKRVVAEGPRPLGKNTVAAVGEFPYGSRHVSVSLEHGRLYVDNHLIDEAYLPEEIREVFDASDPGRELNPGQYYVLGDNRNVSKDSRSFGPIDDDKVIGRAVLRFWPLSKFSLLR